MTYLASFSDGMCERETGQNFKQTAILGSVMVWGVDNCETITQNIVETAQMFVPTRNVNSKYQCPWWSDDCRDAIRARRRAQNRMRRDPHSQFLRIEYRKGKAKTRQILRTAQTNSWRELLSTFNHRTPMRKLWDILRKFSQKTRTMRPLPVLRHNNEILDEPAVVANHFGSYFANMSSQLNYSQAFLEHERELAETMPDFGNENSEDYNKVFFPCGINRCHQTVWIDFHRVR